jgi:hypothetical protein
MNPNLLTVYESPFIKKRIGDLCDGGYVIADLPDNMYDALITGGVNDDISFEENFIRYQKTRPEFKVYAYDGTIDRLPETKLQKYFEFHKLNISDRDTLSTTNLHYRMEQYAGKKLFMKMDIEGGEIPWIRSLTHQMDFVDQLVIEFHYPFNNDEIGVFEYLNRTHLMIHFHPNNGCGFRIHNGINIPNVFECTYLHKKYFHGGEAILNRDFIPNDAVDTRNTWVRDEMYIGHPPFVHFEKYVYKFSEN